MIEEKIDFRHPYLSRQIIAYIGNKRRLLPLIREAVARCSVQGSEAPTFLDLFSGSGVVSRLARLSGFRVVSNDWEYYSYVINRAFLGIEKKELESMYRVHGGLVNLIERLNELPDPTPPERYISRFYSPSTDDTREIDFRRERLFYTRRNGFAIDKIRNKIEELYPEVETAAHPGKLNEKLLLVALLLYECATHTNTSGVFKAYHKGFGGHAGDALPRILAPIALAMPALIDARHRSEVYCEDARMLVESGSMRNRGWDIAYLDPPYNQHQYGSNYHLLTTIARWDKPPVDCSVDERGVLKKKAAIRADWVKTRSEYCYRHSAKSAFAGLLDSLDAAHILLSYSTEGIIPFDELLELCSGRGELEIVTDRYTKYPGGKQSIKRLVGNIEFVLIVHGRRETSGGSLRKIQDVLLRRRLGLLLEKNYSLVRLARNFVLDGTAMTARLPGSRVTFHTRGFFMLVPPFQLDDLIGDELGELVARLAESACRDKQEELAEIFRIIGEGGCDQGFFVMKIPGTLKKFAHKKYRSIFLDWLERTKKTAKELPRLFAPIEGKIRALEELSRKRFSG